MSRGYLAQRSQFLSKLKHFLSIGLVGMRLFIYNMIHNVTSILLYQSDLYCYHDYEDRLPAAMGAIALVI